MSLKYKILSGAVAVVIGLGALSLNTTNGIAAKDGKGPIVAVVNGQKIFRKDVMDVLDAMPMQQNAPLEKIYPMLIDQMINETLMGSAAKSVVKSDDPEVKKRLALAEEQIIRGLYLERAMKNKITDKKIKAEYSKLKKEQEGKKETHARHILVKTEADAKAVIAELDKGAKFIDLAKKKSVGPTGANGGDLGFFAKEDMVPEFSKVAFETKKGKYAKTPVKTQFGWHVIYVEDRRLREVPPMDKLEGAIRSKLGQAAMAVLVKDLRKNAKIKRFSIDGQPLN